MENEKILLRYLNMDLLSECIELYKKELISLQKWYFLKINTSKK